MDRRNGGDPLAPPRPPKLLPRVHRPRAAEPPMMSEPPQNTAQHHQQQQQNLCTNNHSSSSSNNNNINNNNSNNRLTNTIASSRNSNNNNHSSNTAHLTTPLLQLHHQQQHPHNTTISLNRNNSNLSSASSTSSVSTTVSSVNSFTRRRPPPPPLTSLAQPIQQSLSSSPILPLIGASLNLNLLNNNNLNINSIEPVPVSPVTLAAPRPESERLTNEYVDTPFRTAQQLQQASRNQHPAGQHIHGQTTTQHNLLLLQQSQRQQQQQNQQQHHSSHHQSSGSHSNVIGGTCVDGSSAVAAASIHSNSRSLKGGDTTGGGGTSPGFGGSATHATSTATSASATLATSPATITRLQQHHHRPNALPITQPITKQPASATTFKKDLSASIFSEEPLDLHHIGSSGGSSAGGIGSSGMGSPIGGIILGDGAINPITCPRCDRCRCEQCQSPRQLPQTWVCNKTCLCSAETIIDYASCLCCVKALFYHCARDQDMECDDGDSTLCVDDPCSCLPNKRTQRWGWLGALSLVLPCLWCYWPMRGCVAICEKCYARHAGHGCRCQAIGSTSSMLPIVNIGRSGTGGANATIGGTKSSGISGGVHSGISGSGNGHHHHHHHHHGGGGGGGGGGNTNCSDLSAARILRKCDITPEKRLLDSSPEY